VTRAASAAGICVVAAALWLVSSGASAEHPTSPKATRCDACHTPSGWRPARFAHDRTAFPLLGAHTKTSCRECHTRNYEAAIPTTCAGCHQDPHVGELGFQCRSCHDETAFQSPKFGVDAHRRTSFPLYGKHGALPCDECHVGKRASTFDRAAVDCATCHQRDAIRATTVTVDHGRTPFVASCKTCHEPVGFSPATLPGHDVCFPISRGAHVGVGCTECHGSLRGATVSGACAAVGVACADCHVHSAAVEARHHDDVAGYQHASERCIGCHRSLSR